MAMLLIPVLFIACSATEVDREKRQERSREYLTRGIDALRIEDYQKAQAAFEVSNDIYENAAALDGLGCVALSRNRYQEADEWFRQAAALNPAYTHVKGNQGLLALYQGKQALAEGLLKEAILEHPENERFRYNRAMVLLADTAHEHKKEVLEELQRAAVIKKSDKVLDTLQKLEQTYVTP